MAHAEKAIVLLKSVCMCACACAFFSVLVCVKAKVKVKMSFHNHFSTFLSEAGSLIEPEAYYFVSTA